MSRWECGTISTSTVFEQPEQSRLAMPVKKNTASSKSGFSFNKAGGATASATGGEGKPTNTAFGTAATHAKHVGGFSTLQQTSTPGVVGTTSSLTQKCGMSDIDEVRLAYAPLLSIVDNNYPTPTVEYIEPGGIKQPNKSCELYCWVYSSINPHLRKSYDIHDIQRREADKRNPDPSNLESEKIIGTTNLKKRFDKQLSDSSQLRVELDKIHGALTIVERSARKDYNRVKELERDQTRLYHKYLTVLRKVELLRCHGSPITLNEQRYREQLAKIVRAMQSPNLKIQELLIVQAQIDRSLQDVYGDEPDTIEVDKLCGAIDKQREGLQYLTDILSKDARDIDIIRKKLSQVMNDRHAIV